MIASVSPNFLDRRALERIDRTGRQHFLVESEAFLRTWFAPCQGRCTGTPAVAAAAQSVALKVGESYLVLVVAQERPQPFEIAFAGVPATRQRLRIDESGLVQLLHAVAEFRGFAV